MHVLEKIFEELEERGNIQFSSYTKPLIAVEDVLKIIRSNMKDANIKEKPVWEMDIIHHESYDLGRNIGWNECLEAIRCKENDDWIPVEERLPEEPKFMEEDSYIVQTEDIITPFSAYWDGKEWTDVNDEPLERVIAWRPLPERYRAKEKIKKNKNTQQEIEDFWNNK